MYAVDGDLPAVETIGACNCTGLTNLMLRAIGVVLPYDNAVALRPHPVACWLFVGKC
jgi:hypothetical protein